MLKYINHFKLNTQDNQGEGRDLYDLLTSMKKFTLIMHKMFIRAPKIMKEVATTLIWIL